MNPYELDSISKLDTLGERMIELVKIVGTKTPVIRKYEKCVIAIGMVRQGKTNDTLERKIYLSEEDRIISAIQKGAYEGYILREYPNGEKEKVNVREVMNVFE